MARECSNFTSHSIDYRGFFWAGKSSQSTSLHSLISVLGSPDLYSETPDSLGQSAVRVAQ
jgi:hypothetical protein